MTPEEEKEQFTRALAAGNQFLLDAAEGTSKQDWEAPYTGHVVTNGQMVGIVAHLQMYRQVVERVTGKKMHEVMAAIEHQLDLEETQL